MLMEDLKEGQRVIGWRLELSDGTAAGEWAAVANGTSIGHKHIVTPLDSTLVSASSGVVCQQLVAFVRVRGCVQAKRWAGMDKSELRLTVTKTDPRASGPPVIRRLEVF